MHIREQSNIPLVSDIHFDYKIALQVLKNGVDCVRINPGNIGNEKKIKEVIAAARDLRCSNKGWCKRRIFRKRFTKKIWRT